MMIGSDDTFRIDWPSISDDDLVALIKVNNPNRASALIEIFRRAFEEAYQRFNNSTSGIIQAVLRRGNYCRLARCWEDVCQQLWAKLPDVVESYDRNHEIYDVQKSRLQVYLNRSGYYLAIDHLRNSHKEHSIETSERNYDRQPGTVRMDDLVTTVLQLDDVLALRQALEFNELTPIEKTVFLLRINEGLSQNEIKEIVGKEVPAPRYDDRHHRSQEYRDLMESHPEYSQEQILTSLGKDLPLSFEYIAEVTSPTKQGKSRTPAGVKKLYYKSLHLLIESLKKQGFKS